MAIQKDGSIIINNFQQGIGESTMDDFVTMKNMNITDSPGIVTASEIIYQYGPNAAADQTFTADDATDIITVATTNIYNQNGSTVATATGIAVRFTTTDTLPAGLAVDTDYFLIYSSVKNFKVATTYANADDGTAINITDAGTGVHTIVITQPDNIKFWTDNSKGTFGLDSVGNVWGMKLSIPFLLPGGGTYKTKGLGLASFNNFLFVFRSANIDVLDVSTTAKQEDPIGESAWTENWKTLNAAAGSNRSHNSIRSVDGKIYFSDDNYVGSIEELTTFVPATGATYEYSNQALDLPTEVSVGVLEDFGSNLMIAGSDNKLYSWDRTSDSFDLPIQFPSISSIKTINNVLYVLSAFDASIYATNGVSVTRVKLLNSYITDRSNTTSPNQSILFGNAIADGNRLLFGVSVYANDNTNSGVYFYDTITGALAQYYVMDGETLGGTGDFTYDEIYIINPSLGTIFFGDSAGFYRNDYEKYYSSYESQFETGLLKVGDVLNKKAYDTVIFELEENLNNNEKIKIEYKTTLAGTYIALAEFDFATYGAVNYLELGVGLYDITQIEFRVSSQTSSISGLSKVKLKSIIIR